MKNKRFIAGLTAAVLTESMLAAAMPAVYAESIKSEIQRVTLSEWNSGKVLSMFPQGTSVSEFSALGNFRLQAKISNIEVNRYDDTAGYEVTTDNLDVELYFQSNDSWDTYQKKASADGNGNYSLYDSAEYIVLSTNSKDKDISNAGIRVSANNDFNWSNIDEISFDVEYEFVKNEAPAKPQPDSSGNYRYPLEVYTGDQPYDPEGANGFVSSEYFKNIGDNSEVIVDVLYSTANGVDEHYIEPYYNEMDEETPLEISSNEYYDDRRIYVDWGSEINMQFTIKPTSVQAMLDTFSKTKNNGLMFKSSGVLIKSITISERKNAGGVQYTVYNDHVVAEKYTGEEKTVKILDEVDGRPVTEIKQSAFYGNETVEEVILPDSIKTIGYEAFAYCSALKKINIPGGVTVIPRSCFEGCSALEEITLPDGLKEIGDYAFQNCEKLADITFPESIEKVEGNSVEDTAWYENAKESKKLITIGTVLLDGKNVSGKVTVPENIKTISGEAFYGNEELTGITMPEGVESIGDYAFMGTGLKNISIPKSVTKIENNAVGYDTDYNKVKDFVISCYSGSKGYNYAKSNGFGIDLLDALVSGDFKYILNSDENAVITAYTGKETAVVIPEEIDGAKVVEISVGCFKNSGIKELTIPGSIGSVPSECFAGIKTLEKVTFGDGVRYIYGNAFKGCTALKEISLPDSMYEIDNYAFYDCTLLESVTVPKSTYVYDLSFGYHTEKDDEGYDTEVKNKKFKMYVYYGSNAFEYAKENGFEYEVVDLKTDEESGLQYIIEDDHYEGNSAKIVGYAGTSDKLTIPETLGDAPVKHIVWRAFEGSKLKEITFPDSLESIPDYCMRNCTSLEKVTFGKNLRTIEDDAFRGCTSLKSVELPKSVENVYSGAFMDCPLESVTVPRNAYLSSRSFGYHTEKDEYGYEETVKNENFKMYVCYKSRAMQYAEENGFEYEVTDLHTDENGLQYTVVSSDEDYAMVAGCTGKSDKLVIPDSLGGYPVKGFYDGALNEAAIKDLTLPSTLTTVPYSFMKDNTTLEKLTVSSGTRYIYDHAFDGCASLKSVTLPDSLYYCEDYSFYNCPSLESVNVPKSVSCYSYSFGFHEGKDDEGYSTAIKNENFKMYVYYGSSALNYARNNDIDYEILGTFTHDDFVCVTDDEDRLNIIGYTGKDTDITIPGEIEGSAVSVIGDYAFKGNKDIKSVKFSENIRSIGVSAFEGCTSLETVQFPETLGNISENAFLDCDAMTEVTVGKNVSLSDYSLGFKSIESEYGYKNATKRDDFTINTYFGSNAARYAQNNEINYVLLDVKETEDYKYRVYEYTYYDDDYNRRTAQGIQLLEYQGKSNEVVIPDTIDELEVTSLGSDLFKGKAIESIEISDNVRSIDSSIFNGMTSLKSVKLSAKYQTVSYNMFSGCTNLEKAVMPEGVTSISDEAFSGCTKLAEISIPTSVNEIGSDAFKGTKWLEDQRAKTPMVIVNNILVDGTTVSGKAEIPEGVTSICERAFYNNTKLTDVTFPESLYRIGEEAFLNCTSLAEVTVPKNVGSLGYSCLGFKSKNYDYEKYGLKLNCYYNSYGHRYAKNNGLEYELLDVKSTDDFLYNVREDGTVKLLEFISTDSEVIMPEQIKGMPVTEIDENIFDNENKNYIKTLDMQCKITKLPRNFLNEAEQLKKVTLPDTITSIGDYAFEYDKALESINIPESVTSFGTLAFFDTKWLSDRQAEDPLVIVNNVLIDATTAKGVVDIPEGVTTINYSAFENNTDLTEVNIPDSVGSVYTKAFYGCTGMKSVSIPKSVSSISGYAFGYYSKEDEYGYIDTFKDEAFKIYCYYNSEGMEYAEENGFEYELLDLKDNGDFEYVVDGYNGVQILGYKGKSSDVVIPPEIDGKEVYAINRQAFKGNEFITSVVIPSGVYSLDSYQFEGCTKLESVTISNGVGFIGGSVFKNCTALKEVILSEDIDALYSSTFEGCTSLEKINISHIIRLDENVFSGCTSLKDIGFCTRLEYIGENAFKDTAWLNARREETPYVIVNAMLVDAKTVKGEAVIADGTTAICAGAFRGNTDITSVTIPESVTFIGTNSFMGCTSLKEITIPPTVMDMGRYALGYDEEGDRAEGFKAYVYINTAGEDYVREYDVDFEYVDALKYGDFYYIPNDTGVSIARYSGEASVVTVPDKIKDKPVTAIGDKAFSNADTITKVTLPDTVTSIGNMAFDDCDMLKEIDIPDSVTDLGDHAFANCLSLESIALPDNIEVIPSDAFEYCNVLAEVKLPKELRKIDSYAFCGCKSLAGVELPSSVARVGYKAFASTALTEVTIPKSVTNIDSYAFGYIFDFWNDPTPVDGFTVTGYEGTEAQTYAEDNEFKFVSLGEPVYKKGDADGNDVVNAKDMALMQMLINKEINDDQILGSLDLNGDNKVNAKDMAMMQMAVNKEIELK